jgi:hypothetical protein
VPTASAWIRLGRDADLSRVTWYVPPAKFALDTMRAPALIPKTRSKPAAASRFRSSFTAWLNPASAM